MTFASTNNINGSGHKLRINYRNSGKVEIPPAKRLKKVWLTPTTTVPCSNAAKTQNPLKCGGVPQTRQQISAASGLKFTTL